MFGQLDFAGLFFLRAWDVTRWIIRFLSGRAETASGRGSRTFVAIRYRIVLVEDSRPASGLASIFFNSTAHFLIGLQGRHFAVLEEVAGTG